MSKLKLWKVHLEVMKAKNRFEMESRIRIVNVKLVVCFLLVGLLGTSRQYDANCMIRFYAVQHCQCPCWSFNGTNWNYSSDPHKYSDEVVTPTWSNFGFKCIRTLSNGFKVCDNSWRVCLKKRKGGKSLCSTVLKTPQKYSDIKIWNLGRHKMGSLRIRQLHSKSTVLTDNLLSCSGNKCDVGTSGEIFAMLKLLDMLIN